MLALSTAQVLVGCQAPEEEKPSNALNSATTATYVQLLEKCLIGGINAGVTDALQPLVTLIGTELLDLPARTQLSEIKAQLDVIESKLDLLRKEVAEGIEKILSEIDKNNKMQSAIDALARAEYLADLIMSSNDEEVEGDIADLSGAEQQRLVEINASIISKEHVDELVDVLGVAKEYLTSGYIDSNYESAFEIYYEYMKGQSMFCGEAAVRSDPYWSVMVESYAKSCIALLFALEQQEVMYALSTSEAGNGITQEAIDAAAVAKDFGSLNVIKKRFDNVVKDGEKVVSVYREFVADAEAEKTVYINKKNCYIRLEPTLGIIDFNNLKDHATYVASTDFESDGITSALYQETVSQCENYYYGNDYYHLDLSTVSYDNFINNQGKCDHYSTYSDIYGSYDERDEVNFSEYSGKVFANVMFNCKAVRYNSEDKLAHEDVATIVSHVASGYSTKTIADYLTMVGFDFGGNDIKAEEMLYALTADDIQLGNSPDDIKSSGEAYDLAALSKKSTAFRKAFTPETPKGKLVYFVNSNPSVKVTIVSDGMDNRIDMGVYTITAKRLAGYQADGEPEYTYFEKVYQVEDTKTVYVNLPSDIEFSTIKVNLGYEGLAASDNHKSLCSYAFTNYTDGKEHEITLKMRGYTKWWGGYGVDAEILCDGVSLAKGVG